MNPLIDLQDVSKSYGTKWAVRDLSLQISAGELFACLGPNGAGKTTTIKMITGLLRPTRGRVLVADKDMSTNSLEARRCLSYVPDEPHLYEKLSGREFLRFTREIYGLSGADVDNYMEELIDTFEMREYVDGLTETYSHGMRQRLVFASALLHRPRVLVVDEPMVGLDPKSVRIVKDLLKKAAREGTAIFMSTHTLAIAEEMAHRIGIFHQGRLIRCGSIEELRKESVENQTLEDFFLQVTAQTEVGDEGGELAAAQTPAEKPPA